MSEEKTTEQRVSDLEKQVEDTGKKVEQIDDKIGKMLELLQKSATTPTPSVAKAEPVAATPAPAAPEKSDAAPAKKTVKYAPGALMDFWVLTDAESVGDVPTRRSLVTIVDDKKLFEGRRYRSEPSIKCNYDQRMGACWRGYLRIKEAGEHSFSADFTQGGTGYRYGAAYVKIEDTTQHLWKAINNKSYGSWAASTPFNLTLELGLYKIEVWMGCLNAYDSGSLSSLSLDLKMRGPSDRTLRSLTAEDIVHEE